jgi:aminoglycoside 6'-N-acetyltransferase
VAGGRIKWRRLAEEDVPLLRGWLSQPHVARWWNHDTTPEGVRRDFGPSIEGIEPGDDLIALLDGIPVGLVQRSRLADYPEELAAFRRIVDVPDGAVILDYLIGDPHRVGRGLGPRVIEAAVTGVWADLPETPCVLVAVVAANRASWRALEKAGFARVGEGEMEPDNPVDDPLHYVYRFDRP